MQILSKQTKMYRRLLLSCNLFLVHESRLFKIFLIFFFFIFSQNQAFSQTDLIQAVDYNKDSRSIAFMFNSNGYALGYRFSKRLDGYKSRIIDIDFAWVKHPKEIRKSSLYGNQSKFVYGKLNQLIVGRIGYGKQKEIYGKYSESGIAINYYYSFGASIGALKPVYFDVLKIDASGNPYVETEKFDSETIYNSSQIYGGTSFFKGLNEVTAVVGGYAKFAFSFDVNKKMRAINAFELAAIFEFYNKPLALMANTSQDQYLFTLLIAYRFGKKREQRINNQ